jgi:hypothetical protein
MRIRFRAAALLLTMCMGSLITGFAPASPYPAVLHRPTSAYLPNTPAYRSAAVARDLSGLTHDKTAKIVSVVVDTPQRIAALSAYASAVSSPKSPLFHHFLSPQTLNHRFGPTPAVIRQTQVLMEQAGWQVITHRGLVVTARVPSSAANPGLPISPDIWSISGFQRHGLIANPTAPVAQPIPVRHSAAPIPQASSVPSLSLTGAHFNQPPDVVQQTTESNGDVVSVMSWNPLVASSVPAGLPINLFVTVQDPQGNFLPITNVGNLNDSYSRLVSYGTSTMPDSSNTLWQIPIAAWRDIPAGDLLTLSVALQSGATLNASFPLPAFTGPATVLTPLDGQQLNQLSGFPSMPANPGPIALFAIGSPPSLKDLSLYLQQNTINTTPPSVTFRYEDGATPNEYGQSGDSQESQLDLEAAAGAAPGAPIVDYVFPENDNKDPLISFLTDLSQQSTIKIANLSYGFFGEDPNTLTTLMNALTAEGITVLEASGDQGAWNAGNDPGPVGISSLEEVPSVLTVGGVDLGAAAKTTPSGNTIDLTGNFITDGWGGDFLNGIPVAVAQAYTNMNAASSGGFSTTTPIPAWQQGFLPTGATGLGIPDIASLAGFPGMSGFLQGQNVVFGGTSLASPLTAGWLDEVEAALNMTKTGLGNVNPLLYQTAGSSPAAFTQALWGQDGVYQITTSQAGTWNPLTGLGMVNWSDFIAAYNQLVPSTTPSLALAASPSVSVGQNAVVSAYVGGMVNPLLQFSYRSPQNGRWTVGGPTSPASSFSFKASVPGTYTVRVQASSATGSRLTQEINVPAVTKAPMVSGLAVSSTLPTMMVGAHHAFTVTARATDTGKHPEYSFWLTGTRMKKHLVQGWSARGSYVQIPLRPGTYQLTVFALDRAEILKHNWAAAYRQSITFQVK